MNTEQELIATKIALNRVKFENWRLLQSLEDILRLDLTLEEIKRIICQIVAK